jgi:hypothetical protein
MFDSEQGQSWMRPRPCRWFAEILRLQGDLDSADVRRSKAIGILAQPALALELLWQFRDELQPAAEPQQPDEPVDNHPEHRIKTHSRWRLRQPEPGVWLWRSPHRAHYLVTEAGTYNLGHGAFARTVWRAASQADSDHANA